MLTKILKALSTNKKRIKAAVLAAIVLTSMLSITAFAGKVEVIKENVFRLHILANSDSAEDQALKLRVRDKILEASQELFGETANLDDAIAKAEKNRDALKEIAKAELTASGYDYDVSVEVSDVLFDTRYYEDTTFPAGVYKALRVVIGEGKGKNWWCVLFPVLCVPAATKHNSLESALPKEETEIIKNEKNYKVGFKVVEIFESIRGWFR